MLDEASHVAVLLADGIATANPDAQVLAHLTLERVVTGAKTVVRIAKTLERREPELEAAVEAVLSGLLSMGAGARHLRAILARWA